MAGFEHSAVISEMHFTRPRFLSLQILCVSLVTTAFGAAPDSVAGLMYHEESVTTVRSNVAFGRVLNPDGTFRGIYSASTYGTFSLEVPVDGTWSYRKTGENTGELVFGGGSDVRRLVFAGAEHGSLTDSGTLLARIGTFSIAGFSSQWPLVNCSNRSTVPVRGVATAGFVVTNNSNRVLVRAVGPSLSRFGAREVLSRPILTVFAGQTPVVANAGWGTIAGRESLRRVAEQVGAFPLPEGSADSAVFLVLPPGAYTAQVSSESDAVAGEVLAEVYILR